MAEQPVPSVPQNNRWPFLYGSVTLVSAFLLFQVQLIIAKYILPWFGGSAAVWTTCILFFQVLLLLGYAYTHFTGRLAPDRRFELHSVLLLVSAVLLAGAGFVWRSPIAPDMRHLFFPGAPTGSVLLVLLVSVGFPFFLLSSTSPLLQSWFWRSEQRSPYRLYALSNLGSLAGLLTYPFLFEPTSSIIQQGWIWFTAYAAFCCGTILCGVRVRGIAPPEVVRKPRKPSRGPASPSGHSPAMWIVLAAAGSALMLATTNFLTQDIAAVPLLWVVPLSIYLLSFVVTFESDRIYRRSFVLPGFAIAVAASCYALARSGEFSMWGELAIVNAMLAFGTVLCHGELARLRPQPEALTRFYLWIAVGGAIGSGFVGLIAPHVFPDVWEFPITLVTVATLGALAVTRDSSSRLHSSDAWKSSATVVLFGLLPLMVLAEVFRPSSEPTHWVNWTLFGLALTVAAVQFGGRRRDEGGWGRPFSFAALFLVPVLLACALAQLPETYGQVILRRRNFFGVLTLTKDYAGDQFGWLYGLYHGRILHGRQALKPELRSRPTTYYGNFSGVGLALLLHPRHKQADANPRDLRVGIVGMGTGTILTYADAGDYYRSYELNPAVIELSQGANPYFTYLHDCRGTCEVATGDGRELLQREADAANFGRFDVLALDAFSGDAIPVHLLTRQAFQLYLRHLRDDDSLIAVHVSNRVLNIAPVLGRIARELGLHAVRIDSPARGEVIRPSEWVLIGKHDPPLVLPPEILKVDRITPLPGDGPLWTDDFSNLLSVIRR